MEALVENGLTRNVGISNFQGSLILDLLRYAKIWPVALQIEHHPYLVQPTLTRLVESEGIAVVTYSTFGPTSFIELDWKKAHDTPVLFDHSVITKIAKQHVKTPAQVTLRWVTQRGIAVIPKSNSQSRLEQNLYVTDFDLKDDEIEAISGLDRNLRFNNSTDVSLPFCAAFRARLIDVAVPWHSSHICVDIQFLPIRCLLVLGLGAVYYVVHLMIKSIHRRLLKCLECPHGICDSLNDMPVTVFPDAIMQI
jgi:hypothetical protein